MALVALLSAREMARNRTAAGSPGELLDFGGQPLIEFQARLAINAGAERILIHTDSASQDLAQLVDRIAAERNVEAALVRDVLSLSRGITVDDRILLIAENLVLPPEPLASLLVAGPAAMLALPAVPATAAFERIDAEAMWAGALCMPGATMLSTLDMLGDWDLTLTLLRRAVQDGERRVALSPELVMDGRLTIIQDQASADLALQSLSDRSHAALIERTAAVGSLFAPVSRAAVRELVRRQVEPTSLATAGLLIGAGALALAVGGWMVAAMLVILLALGASELAHQTAIVTLRAAASPWRHWLVQAAGILVLAILGFHVAGGYLVGLSGAWLPLFLVGLLVLTEARMVPAGLWTRWVRITVPAATIILLVGQLVSRPGPAFALLGLLTAVVVAVRLLPSGNAKV